jgi:hypothetical protein
MKTSLTKYKGSGLNSMKEFDDRISHLLESRVLNGITARIFKHDNLNRHLCDTGQNQFTEMQRCPLILIRLRKKNRTDIKFLRFKGWPICRIRSKSASKPKKPQKTDLPRNLSMHVDILLASDMGIERSQQRNITEFGHRNSNPTHEKILRWLYRRFSDSPATSDTALLPAD